MDFVDDHPRKILGIYIFFIMTKNIETRSFFSYEKNLYLDIFFQYNFAVLVELVYFCKALVGDEVMI